MFGANAFGWAYFGEVYAAPTSSTSPGGGGFGAPKRDEFFQRYKPTIRTQKKG